MNVYPYIVAPIAVGVVYLFSVVMSAIGMPQFLLLVPIWKSIAVVLLGLSLVKPIQFIAQEIVSLFMIFKLMDFSQTAQDLTIPDTKDLKEKIQEVIVVGICLLAVCLL